MCKYPGWEIIQHCRTIAAQEDDALELVRKDRQYVEGTLLPGQVEAARNALLRAGDQRALAVLERLAPNEPRGIPQRLTGDFEGRPVYKWG
jgi:hypothetical protein